MEVEKKIDNLLSVKRILTKCPNCNKKSKKNYDPFCSEKCSNLDLIKWLIHE